jgi:hypothetical protein
MGFFNSAEYTYLEQRESISALKHLCCRKHPFQKPTQFSQGTSVLDAQIVTVMVFCQKMHLFLQLS